MPDEENKEKENSAPASGDQNQDEPSKEGKPETPDYKAELDKKEKEYEQKLKEKEDQINKAGFTIQKLKERMKEEGIDLDEGKGLTEEQVESIVSKAMDEKFGKLSQENQELRNQLSETLKAISSKNSVSKGGGEGGQKPPKEEGTPRPKLNPDEEKAVEGMTWDSKKGGWVDNQTKQFFPHKRKTVSPLEEKK